MTLACHSQRGLRPSSALRGLPLTTIFPIGPMGETFEVSRLLFEGELTVDLWPCSGTSAGFGRSSRANDSLSANLTA